MIGDGVMPLLDVSGSWTNRDRQRHREFAVRVPELAEELWIRFRWGPAEVGAPAQRNLLTLSVFDPHGFRGAAVRWRAAQEIVISERAATPGFLLGPILPGDWTIVVDAHEILNDGLKSGRLGFQLEAAARRDQTAKTGDLGADGSRGPHLARKYVREGSRWYRGDLHSHTVHSDGSSTVADRASAAAQRGLDFLAITDHNTISQARADDPWPEELSRIRGSEITTFHGHLNILGLGDGIDWRNEPRGGGAAGILKQAALQKAIVVINHPSAYGNPECTGCHWDFARVDYTQIDAIEVWNGRWSAPENDNAGALALWTDLLRAGLHPTALAGTDSHSAEEDQHPDLPFTHVFAAEPDEASIVDAIRRGRVYLSSGPLLTFRAQGPDGAEVSLPGERLPSSGPFDLLVDIQDLATRATLWYVADGAMKALDVLDGPGRHLRYEELVAERWWRLEVRQGEESVGDLLVLTNPVHVGNDDQPVDGDHGRH